MEILRSINFNLKYVISDKNPICMKINQTFVFQNDLSLLFFKKLRVQI